ncbi:MAG: 4a-hydroxytetrahydrobiopterin dehydratase [Acidobacteriota bacterium]
MTKGQSSVSTSLDLEPAAYYQLLWESGLAGFPGPGDLPGHLKPERIQKTLAQGRAALLSPGKKSAPGPAITLPRLGDAALRERSEAFAGWRLADDNRSLVRPFVLDSSEAALGFAAFITGILQAAGSFPAMAVVLNTVWVVLTNPRVRGLTEVELALAERLSRQSPDHPSQANVS